MTWQLAWEEGRTPWDAGAASPALEALVAAGSLPDGLALVPGAGSGYDVLALASPRRAVIGLDLSPLAAERFEGLRDAAGVPADRARLVVGDFFEWSPPTPVDLVWDYTFLCALEPSRRGDWLRRTRELLSPTGELVLLLFPVQPIHGDPSRPPHPIPPDVVRALVEPVFDVVHLEPTTRSHPGREGNEWLGRFRPR